MGADASLRCLALSGLVGLAVLVSAGCQEVEEIRTYRAPKLPRAQGARLSESVADPHRMARPGSKSRMLAAIIPHRSDAWFFKVTGPDQATGRIKDSFIELIRSVRFAQGAGQPPSWTLPDSWRQQPGSALRYATIVIDTGDVPMELSVTRLPLRGDVGPYILSNINRWRSQMTLPAIELDQLTRETVRIELDRGQATMVDLLSPGALNERPRPGSAFAPIAPSGSPRQRKNEGRTTNELG